MNDRSSFEYAAQGSETGPLQPQTPPNMAQYKFSPDEMRVLQDCNRESFYTRSLPLASILGLGTGVAVQSGFLRPSPRFGPFPKVTLAVIVGYFLGKISYQQACAEKLMALPGSYIGQLLRDRRDGKSGGTNMGTWQPPPSPMLGARPDDIYSDAGPGESLDLDSDRMSRVFSEDLSRPDHGLGATLVPDPGSLKPPMTYDELRRRNRGEHAATQEDPYRVETDRVPIVRRAPPAPRPAQQPVNAYGDVIE